MAHTGLNPDEQPAASPRTVVFVDYENVHELRAADLPERAFVMFFRGVNQTAIDDETLDVIVMLGHERFTRITLTGQGKDALDFHIAFYLGVELDQRPSTTCVVLSRDTGFDPLVQHLRNRGFDVSRREPSSPRRAAVKAPVKRPAAAKEPPPAKKSTPTKTKTKTAPVAKTPKPPPKVEDVVALLAKLPAANRPRKRESLVRVVATHYTGRIDAQKAEALVHQLFDAGKLAENEGKLTFHC